LYREKILSFSSWKGFAIIGNGDVCTVYSDDNRLKGQGLQHFYYKDYTADYISSTSVEVIKENGSIFGGKKSIGMADFFLLPQKL